MNKKIINTLLIIFLSIFFVSATITTKNINAIKYGSSSNGVPISNMSIRILNPSNIQLGDADSVQVPIYARDNTVTAFSWSFTGNVFDDAELTFTVSPMKNVISSTEIAYLPFTINFQAQATTVGDITIPYYLEDYNSTIGFTPEITSYRMSYEDRIKIGNTYKDSFENANKTLNFTSSSTSNKRIKFTYNMKNGTKILDTNSNIVENYDYDICHQWNRNGIATIKINLGSEESPQSGRYSAQIIVGITGV